MLTKVPVCFNLVLRIYHSFGPWKSLNLILTHGQEPWNCHLCSLLNSGGGLHCCLCLFAAATLDETNNRAGKRQVLTVVSVTGSGPIWSSQTGNGNQSHYQDRCVLQSVLKSFGLCTVEGEMWCFWSTSVSTALLHYRKLWSRSKVRGKLLIS